MSGPADACPLCGHWMDGRTTTHMASFDHFIPFWMTKSLPRTLRFRRFGPFKVPIPAAGWVICRQCNLRKGGRLPNAAETFAYSQIKGHCKR